MLIYLEDLDVVQRYGVRSRAHYCPLFALAASTGGFERSSQRC